MSMLRFTSSITSGATFAKHCSNFLSSFPVVDNFILAQLQKSENTKQFRNLPEISELFSVDNVSFSGAALIFPELSEKTIAAAVSHRNACHSAPAQDLHRTAAVS